MNTTICPDSVTSKTLGQTIRELILQLLSQHRAETESECRILSTKQWNKPYLYTARPGGKHPSATFCSAGRQLALCNCEWRRCAVRRDPGRNCVPSTSPRLHRRPMTCCGGWVPWGMQPAGTAPSPAYIIAFQLYASCGISCACKITQCEP